MMSYLLFHFIEREDVSKECFKRNFRATISPTDNLAAEQELQKEIK